MPEEITMKAAEATPADAGKGFARVSLEDMRRLNAYPGDIVYISCKKRTVAKLMPAEGQARGTIRIDSIVRKNSGTSVGEKVNVSVTPAAKASFVALASREANWRDKRYIGRILDSMPLIKGDLVRAPYFGTAYREYVVKETRPDGPVIFGRGTAIEISKVEEGEEKRPLTTSYEDVGGLGKELRKIREMIELPLKFPEVFERAGIEPPKGMLLYGPPGTGKTLIARAVANETSAFFMHVNGPEIMHKHYGESEGRLREIFELASQKAPAIIFIDELDVIAPRREKIAGDVEKRVVGQLLALMDGLKSRGQVVVIGATNIPNAIDPALRRPGRFDREMSISVPDKESRLEILKIHTRGMPLSGDVDTDHLAEITHGYVGADLAALCSEAAMIAIRRLMPSFDMDAEEVSPDVLAELHVDMADFLEAYGDIVPSTTREVFVEVPDVSWDDIGGLEDIKNELRKTIEWPLKYKNIFKYANIKPPKGILLYGPPGTGKTLIAKAAANESSANFISIKGPELLSKWVGESENGIRETFKKARQAAPCIIFFDELDAIATRRGRGGDTQVTERIVSQMLTEMDGIEELKGVTVLAATNRLDMIDPALLRPGRFDLLMEVPVPGPREAQQIFDVHNKDRPVSPLINKDKLVRMMEGYTGADIATICRESAMNAIMEYLDQKGDPEKPDFIIKQKHFEEAINTYERSLQMD